MICGIDYGSKLAGTTVCAWIDEGIIRLAQSKPKQDADAFLTGLIAELRPVSVYIDAPLSLPAAYFDHGTNFFYRACDVELKAMSPLFLGGLTARAMRLAKAYQEDEIPFYEVYPAGLWRLVGDTGLAYKKSTAALQPCLKKLEEQFQMTVPSVNNWHQFDALLALRIGLRHQVNEAMAHGNDAEGVIWI